MGNAKSQTRVRRRSAGPRPRSWSARFAEGAGDAPEAETSPPEAAAAPASPSPSSSISANASAATSRPEGQEGPEGQGHDEGPLQVPQPESAPRQTFAYAQDDIPLPNTPSVRDLRARFPGVDADTLRRFLRAKRPQQMLTTHLAWKRAELPIDVSPSSSPAAALTKRYVDQGFFTVAASSDPRRLNCVVDGAVLAGLSAEGGYDADAAVRSMLHLLETNMPDGRYGV